MIYPIMAYGTRVLREKSTDLQEGTEVRSLVDAMFTTMDQAGGVGLSAPQIGRLIRLFVVDLSAFMEQAAQLKAYRKVYINPTLKQDKTHRPTYHEEGCLSIPGVKIQVPRIEALVITYFDIHWRKQEEELTNMSARVIQHEYDHLDGRLHIDYASPLEKRLLSNKLADIRQGKVPVDYAMHFADQ